VADAKTRSVLLRVAESNYSSARLISLLSDPSPRVRTVALELLFRKQDPQLLPYIFERSSDHEITFDHLVYYNYRANGPPDSKRDSQTVADFANAMLRFWGVHGDFREFWAARKGHAYWFSLLYSRLSLITGGLLTLNSGVRARLEPFRDWLDRLPELDRNLYLIWLQSTFTEPALADDLDLSQAVRRLGRENILAIAEGQPPGGDPELQPSWDPARYRAVAALVLNHARGVLLPADAARLAAYVQRDRQRLKSHPDPRDPRWDQSYIIAQAWLLPDRASELLHADIQYHSGHYEDYERAQLVATLLELRGQAEMPFIRDFFFGNFPAQDYFIASLESTDQPLVEALLDDARLAQLGPEIAAHIYTKFPGIKRELVRDWFFAQKKDPRGAGNSIQYFLRAVLWACDHGTYRGLLADDRLSTLDFSILFELEQELSYYKIPRELWVPFSHQREVIEYFVVGSKHQLSADTIPQLIRLLHAAAGSVDARHTSLSCSVAGQ
jgi:hypothetical protein